MAALPLTLDTLQQSPSNEELAIQTSLMSPQNLKADTTNNLLTTTEITTTTTATPERPSNLILETSTQQLQQQHSNVTPSSTSSTTAATATALHGNISPALSSAGSLSPSFLPEMPQWKRDLIQRRKQSVQRTISASSPTASAAGVSPSSSAASPTTSSMFGIKASTSSSSVRSLAGSNTNIDQVASDGLHSSTKDYNKIITLTSYSSSTSSSSTTTSLSSNVKVNKQHATTTTMPATIIKSPIKEKAEKLFGGQYTATSSISTTATAATVTTKEETMISTTTTATTNQQQDIMMGLMEEASGGEEEHLEKLKKTKEYFTKKQNDEHDGEDQQEVAEEGENDETQTTTTTTAATTAKQQMATRLTGSSSTHTLLLTQQQQQQQRESILIKERENFFSNNTKQHNNITTGANINLQNQSLNKCESERLVCTANTTTTTAFTTVNNNNTNTNNNSGGGTSGSVVKISQKLKENQFIKNEQQQQQQLNTNNKKFIKFKTNSQDLKSPTKSSSIITTTTAATTSLSSSSSSTSLTTNCAIIKKMVAVQEMKKSTQNSATHLHPINTTCNTQQQQANRANNRNIGGGGGGVANSSATDLDNNEDLSYGPGIVSKLRCRYLSLALRETMEQQRLNKDQLRRSTSLNNLLDNTEDDDEEDNCDEEDEEENIEIEGDGGGDRQESSQINNENSMCKKTGILKNTCNNQEKRFSHNSQGSNGVGVTFTETSFNKRSRHLKRGNDSLKRARSVEALLSEKSPWQSRVINTSANSVTIEDKIHNARERLQQGTDHMPPKRLTSIIDDTERPPPDLVKQTLKMFEASANRRPRTTNRSNSKGDVASKVETFKNIIKEQKPIVSYPKPTSPTKKMNTPIFTKPLKTSTPQAADLLQSPLGRKTLAMANAITSSAASNNANNCSTPLKSNALSEHTPDIIPRQNVNNERDFKQTKEIFTTNQINKEKFLSSLRDTDINDSPLAAIKKEKVEVDSPLSALTKELGKMKLNDNTPTRKIDNFNNDKYEINNGGGGVLGGGGGNAESTVIGGDACYSHNKNQHNEQPELIKNNSSSSLKNEKHDKQQQKQINNETIEEITNEATVNYNDSLATKASPPPSSSDLSDGEEDDEYGGLKTKRITRTALDNIAKAGYTQQFKFNSTSSSNNATSSPNSNNSHSSPSVKQIGVIRPLLNTNNQQQQQKVSSDMDTLKHSSPSSLTSREIEKNRINDLKKSSTNSSSNNTTTSSPTASLDNVIKSSTTSSSSSSSPNTAASSAAAAAASSGFSDVDSVISATNSPLWAMRKRRQAPPSAPAENTTMVFNFSNRKEVPDYIENDGVIFRRKRELPKPNESGFVLLGDLSVETSTDLDYDDFSMCPPSPCDVEFENANIVIDGKSSIRQKAKDATFRVQFNDTLTSTFEYPSEASLIVDESFSAYNDGYTQPHGSANDFTLAFQNLVLESSASAADQMSSHLPIHHVADEIIQLPTINASSPANTSNTTTATSATTATPTKNILGNLPLDYPDLEKSIPLTIPTATTPTAIIPTEITPTTAIQDPEMKISTEKRSRKDLKLPLGNQYSLQKPPLPVKRFQVMTPPPPALAKSIHLKQLPIKSKDFPLQENNDNEQKKLKEEDIKNANNISRDGEHQQQQQPITKQRKLPGVLNNPQYACFLQQEQLPRTKYTVQRSRSNEFQKSFGSMPLSTTPTTTSTATVLRSNSLRNLETYQTSSHNQNSFSIATSSSTATATSIALYYSPEVNSNENLLKSLVETAKTPPPALYSEIYATANCGKNLDFDKTTPSLGTAIATISSSCKKLSDSSDDLTENSVNLAEKLTNKSSSLNNLPHSGDVSEFSENISYNSLLSTTNSLDTNFADNLLNSISKSVDSFPENIDENSLNSKSKSVDSLRPVFSSERSFAREDNLLNSNTKSLEDFTESVEDIDFTEYSVNKTDNLLKSKHNFSNPIEGAKSTSVDDFDVNKISKDLMDNSVNMADTLLSSKTKSMVNLSCPIVGAKSATNDLNIQLTSMEDFNLNKTSENLTDNSDKFLNSPKKSVYNLSCPIKGAEQPTNDLNVRSALETSNDLSNNSVNMTELREMTDCPINVTVFMDLNLNKTSEDLTDNSVNTEDFTNSVLTFSNMSEQEDLLTSSKSVDNLKLASHYCENIKENFLNSKSKSFDNFNNTLDSQDLREFVINENLNPKNDFFIASADIPPKTPTSNLKGYLQMSLDSLDDYQDAVEMNSLEYNFAKNIGKNLTTENKEKLADSFTKNSLTQESIFKENYDSSRNLESLCQTTSPTDELSDTEAMEILEDISVGPNFSKLKKFEHTSSESFESDMKSLESEEQFDMINVNANSAESQESSCKIIPAINPLQPKVSTKPSKTLRVKTTEKIINLTNMARYNASTYSTFRKSQIFYKQASKSFKNSLKFYENFNTTQVTNKENKKTDYSLKGAARNRKEFAKTARKFMEDLNSPTENSYSFEYYDAAGDLNGNLVNRLARDMVQEENDHENELNLPNALEEEPYQDFIIINTSTEDSADILDHSELHGSDLTEFSNDNELGNDLLTSIETTNLKEYADDMENYNIEAPKEDLITDCAKNNLSDSIESKVADNLNFPIMGDTNSTVVNSNLTKVSTENSVDSKDLNKTEARSANNLNRPIEGAENTVLDISSLTKTATENAIDVIDCAGSITEIECPSLGAENSTNDGNEFHVTYCSEYSLDLTQLQSADTLDCPKVGAKNPAVVNSNSTKFATENIADQKDFIECADNITESKSVNNLECPTSKADNPTNNSTDISFTDSTEYSVNLTELKKADNLYWPNLGPKNPELTCSNLTKFATENTVNSKCADNVSEIKSVNNLESQTLVAENPTNDGTDINLTDCTDHSFNCPLMGATNLTVVCSNLSKCSTEDTLNAKDCTELKSEGPILGAKNPTNLSEVEIEDTLDSNDFPQTRQSDFTEISVITTESKLMDYFKSSTLGAENLAIISLENTVDLTYFNKINNSSQNIQSDYTENPVTTTESKLANYLECLNMGGKYLTVDNLDSKGSDSKLELNLTNDCAQAENTADINLESCLTIETENTVDSEDFCVINDIPQTKQSDFTENSVIMTAAKSMENVKCPTSGFENPVTTSESKTANYIRCPMGSKYPTVDNSENTSDFIDSGPKLVSNLTNYSNQVENTANSQHYNNLENCSTENSTDFKFQPNLTNISIVNTVGFNTNLTKISTEKTDDSEFQSNLQKFSVNSSEFRQNLAKFSTADLNMEPNLNKISPQNIVDPNLIKLSAEKSSNSQFQANLNKISSKFSENTAVSNTNFKSTNDLNKPSSNLPTPNFNKSKFQQNLSKFSTQSSVSKTHIKSTNSLSKNRQSLLKENIAENIVHFNFPPTNIKRTLSVGNHSKPNLTPDAANNSKLAFKLNQFSSTDGGSSELASKLTKFSIGNTVNSELAVNFNKFSSEEYPAVSGTNFPYGKKFSANLTKLPSQNIAVAEINFDSPKKLNKNEHLNTLSTTTNLTKENDLNANLKSTAEQYFNSSPRPFRRTYEVTTTVEEPEENNSALSERPKATLNSYENLNLSSPRPFKRAINRDDTETLCENPENKFSLPNSSNESPGSAPLGFYTPLKAPIDRLFQLGVTRAPYLCNDSPTSPPATTNGVSNFLNGGGNGSIVGITDGLIDIDGGDEYKNGQEPESLQYIKPADDDLNLAYSEGTQKTDLLY